LRFAMLAFSATLLFSGALAAQEHSHPGVAATPVPEVPANPDISRVERSEEILVSIRSAAGKKDAAALRSATEAYVSNISELKDEIGRLSRSESAKAPDLLAIGRKVASQATDLDSLARAVPRQLRKDVDRALAAADGLLGTLTRGRSSPPEQRAEPRPEPAQHAGHAH
jgi:hypothetical protein